MVSPGGRSAPPEAGCVSSGELRAELDALSVEWLALMRAGQFEQAWRTSDCVQRLQAGLDCSRWPRHQQFIWRGAPLEGRRVLVRCYHGLGDTLQFARFARRLRHRVRKITMWVQPALIPLLQASDCADRFVPLHEGAPNIDYDVDVELSELMHVLRVTADTLAAGMPYLRAGPRVPRTNNGALRVGLVWAAGEWDRRRSIPCGLLAPLGAILGIDWHLLQRGPALAQWCYPFGTVPRIRSILDEARAMLATDLVITVDTCSAHLAGSLGIPVWTLLHYDADWRWMEKRSDTPWYPTMRLMRQPEPGAWDRLMRQVASELLQEVCDSIASKRMAWR